MNVCIYVQHLIWIKTAALVCKQQHFVELVFQAHVVHLPRYVILYTMCFHSIFKLQTWLDIYISCLSKQLKIIYLATVNQQLRAPAKASIILLVD